MEYSIPAEHPLGAIEVEYDRLDYYLGRDIRDMLRFSCAALREGPSKSSEFLLLADLFEGLLALGEGNLQEGMPKLRAALAGPSYIHIRAASAIAAQEVANGNLSAAAEILRPLETQAPPSPHFYTALGTYLASAGDFAAGWGSYVRALQINPNHLPALWFMQPLVSSLGRQREYKELLLRFLEEVPENGTVRTYLASCLFALDEIDEAWVEIKRIVAFLEVAPIDDNGLDTLRKLTTTIAAKKGGGAHG